MSEHTRLPVAVLGATGLVGQHYVDRLARHPWFELVALAASERHESVPYQEIPWRLPGAVPPAAASLPLLPCRPEALPAGVQVVFSALPSEPARNIEVAFAQAGKAIFSNARAHRMDKSVPLLLADVNPWHLPAVVQQRKTHGWQGSIVCKANCTTSILALALAPLQVFGIRRVQTVTYQSISGAGYPGVAAWDILGNVVPFIAGEEASVEGEVGKLLGEWDAEHGFRPAAFPTSAHCARVPTVRGHLECVSVELERRVDPEQVVAAWERYLPETVGWELPSAPRHALVYLQDENRPQPGLDWPTGGGMTVSVGRLQPCPAFGEGAYSFWCVGDNLGRGAAGGCLLNAELFVARGYLKELEDTLELALHGVAKSSQLSMMEDRR
jgi:aspartate-semialdehyde dehydrogenase